MQKYKSFVLPVAIVLGLLFHRYCAMFNVLVPYLIFSILLLTFCAVDIRKLRMSRLAVWLMLFQVVVSLASYLLLRWLGVNPVISEAVLLGILCPVAASVAVISCMLGANRETVTSYTIFGNLMVAVVAPVYFSFIGNQQSMPFLESFWMIIKHIGAIIGLPFFVALALQLWLPKANAFLSRYKGLAFYLWSLALLFTLGQTFDYLFLHGEGQWTMIAWLGVGALVVCAMQILVGKWLGRRFGDVIAGGQLLGQKNNAMGIWMANHYLSPISAIFMAFYSIYQNCFNSWQIWRHERRTARQSSPKV